MCGFKTDSKHDLIVESGVEMSVRMEQVAANSNCDGYVTWCNYSGRLTCMAPRSPLASIHCVMVQFHASIWRVNGEGYSALLNSYPHKAAEDIRGAYLSDAEPIWYQ